MNKKEIADRQLTDSDACLNTGFGPSMFRRYQQLEALNNISKATVEQDDLDNILNIAIDNILKVTGESTGGILLIDRESKALSYRVHRGMCTNNVEKLRVPLGEGISGKVARTGEPALITDASLDTQFNQYELGGVEHVREAVSIPLERRGEIVGAIIVASEESGRFKTDDIHLLSTAASYVTFAVVRLRVEGKINKGMERYRALLRYALNAQEDERKRVARELHDETSQTLASLSFRLQALIQRAEMEEFGDGRFKESLQKAHSFAVQAGSEIVKLMMDLRPTMLDDLGMSAAIHRYAKDTLEAKGINVMIEFIGWNYRLPTEVEVALFRVTQGLISNILKHSQAKNALIRAESDSRRATLYIEDDGIGFDIDKVTEVEPNGRGAGLFTMRERLRLVGGTGHVESKPGCGTRITISVPIVSNLEDLVDEEDKDNDCR